MLNYLFKKDIRFKNKKAWIDYYLINILRRINKFFINDKFGKTIIKKNNDKIRLSANTILNKFLRKIVILNIISLAKIREVITKKN